MDKLQANTNNAKGSHLSEITVACDNGQEKTGVQF